MLVSQRVSNRVMKDRSNTYMIYAEYKRFHNLEWYADNMMYDSMYRAYITNKILFRSNMQFSTDVLLYFWLYISTILSLIQTLLQWRVM